MRISMPHLVLPIALLAGCSQAETPPQLLNVRIVAPLGPIPRTHARVRIMAPQLGPGWRTGMFNQTRTEPPCYVVLLFHPRQYRTVAGTVSVHAVERIQVSAKYLALPGDTLDPDPGAASYDAEEWTEVPLDSVRAVSRNCPATIERTPETARESPPS